MEVLDLVERKVATLISEEKVPGTYKVKFNGSKFANGVYFYRIITGSSSLGTSFYGNEEDGPSALKNDKQSN